ncbi:MAG: DNA polymerase III subunit alpha [Hormoscilla sp. GUM202]|nr:DNA polymerase III subunit alpha [Hormoscilla sp. GUM202]
MDFVGLHIHSDYSLLDGASQLPELVSRAKELGMEAIALTDHGVMYGAIELIKVCRSKNIRPIIGNEMYVINETIKNHKGKYSHHHQTVLAKNTQGYKNLVKLTTKSHLEGKRGSGIFARPCITKELLAEYHEGLIVTSGCRAGEVPKLILNDRAGEAWEVAKWYKEIFGDDYYLEIQDHGYQEDRIVNVKIWDMAQKLEIKVVATNDSHYIDCYDVEAHDALLCINTNKLFNDEKRTFRYSGTEYLKSAEEMKQLFRDHLPDKAIEEAIANTVEVANKVQVYDIMGAPRIPNYQKEGHTPDSFLEEKTWKGLEERLNCKGRKEIETRYPEYKERLEIELKVMQEKKFSSYFLVVWDYIDYARENHIPVGPGRGSAAGSLVAYALKITNIDPVHHGLLFERFLNPERKSMPDIDSDFCIERRDDMIEYVTNKYGAEKVAQIITFNRMTSKAVLKDVGRVLGVSYGDADRMAKYIPVARGKPAKLKEMISDESPEPKFKEAYENGKVEVKDDRGEITGEIPVRQWIDMAMRLEGTNKSAGVHAAGVVISAEPLDEIVPLQKNNEGAATTQYSMEELESLGLLKMDFLGLKNLTIIQNTVELIKENHQRDIDPDQLPLDERKAWEIIAKGTAKKIPEDIKNTYELLGKGDLEGIFQLESSGMRQVVQKLKPDNIEDISSILALYRPGPLDAGLVDKFIDRKHGREPIEYEHPMLEPILKETYAVMVYQEQIMRIAQDLGGYSLGQADLLRRCLSGSTEIIDAATGGKVALSEIASNPEYWLRRKVFSLDLQTQKITQQPIDEIYPNGMRSVWEITTKTNRKIRATADHLFYTLLGWKPLGDFQVGDRIGLAKNIPIDHSSEISEVIGIIAKAKKASGMTWAEIDRSVGAKQGTMSSGLNFQKSSNRSLSRHRVQNFATAFQDPELMNIAESDVFWDRIVSIEYMGDEEVFDLTIRSTHNLIANDFIAHNCIGKKKVDEMQKHRERFIDGSTRNGVKTKIAESLFDQMVKFAEYCFNKSHSTAYAYVTYQTAYLKANYPEEYMAVLLSENSSDQDKVQKYIANCKKIGIEVEGPDINRSGVKFMPEGKKILFGLSAVKNLGTHAIESIIKAREASGEFQDLAEMCDRLDLQAVNKRALEALIKCGAFDRINDNRHQLVEYLPKVTEWAQKNKNSLNSGSQLTLFDMENFKTPAPELPVVKDFTVQEKLQLEKEYLGYYVSDHPLTSVQQPDDAINLDELEEQKGKPQIKVLVMLTEVKQHITKKGDRMAFLQIEDLTGKAEAIVFPSNYENIAELLVTDKAIVLTGKPDRQDEQKVQLIVDNAEQPKQQGMLSAPQSEPEWDSQPPEDQLRSDEPEQSEENESISSDDQQPEQQLLNLQPQSSASNERLPMAYGKEDRGGSSIASFDQPRKQEIEMEPKSQPEENEGFPPYGQGLPGVETPGGRSSIASDTQAPEQQKMNMEPQSGPEENKQLVRVRTAQQSYVFPASDLFRSPTQTKGEIDRQKLQHLKSVQLTAKKLGLDPIDLSQLSQQHPQGTVAVVATIADLHQQEHKPEGDLLTFLLLEDLNGSGVAMIKPDLYQKIGSSLIFPERWEDSFVILWGKVQHQDAERWLLMVSDAVQIEPNYLVVLKLKPEMASSKLFHQRLYNRLKDLSGETNKPKVPTIAIVEGNDFHIRRVIRFGHELWVQAPENAVKIINNTFTFSPAALLNIPGN